MSELKIPIGWEVMKIKDVSELINGRAFKPEDWKKHGLPIIRIQNLNDPAKPFNYYDSKTDDRYLINRGDLLFAWSGTPGTSFGAHIWGGEKAILNQHIYHVITNDVIIDKNYLKYVLNRNIQEYIGKAHGAVGLRHITKGKLEDSEILVPPLSVQKKIVQKLDHILGQLEEKKREILELQSIKLKNSKYLSDNFMNYIISKFIPIENHPVSWKSVTLADIFLIINQKWQPNSISTSLNYIGLENIESNTGKLVNFLPINSLKIKSLKTHFLKKHVLYGKLRPYLNKILLPTFDGVCSTDILVLEPKSIVLREFLAYFLRSSHVLSKMTQLMYGTKMPRAKIQDLEKIRLGLPSKEEQEKIIRKIQRSENHIHTIRESITTSIEQQEKTSEYLKYLRSSILDKVFSGKLVT